MIFSKNKSSCAYAKVCKSKPKLQNAFSSLNHYERSSERKENIYEELMNELEVEDSQYIQRLLQKNNSPTAGNFKKNHKFDQGDNQNLFAQTKKISEKKEKIQQLSQESEDIPQFGKTQKIGSAVQRAKIHKQRESESESCSDDGQVSHKFINRIDNYLSNLSRQNKPVRVQRKSSKNERQFRKTIDVTEKTQNRNEASISAAKYEILMNKLRESLFENDRLECELQQKQEEMKQMKILVKSMFNQMHELKTQLQQQKQQKQRYSLMLEDFVSKIDSVRSSKEKHYIPNHQKRNSHTPCSNSFSRQDFFNRTDLQTILNDRTNHFELSRANRECEQINSLKKKGKKQQKHRYKMSQNYLDIMSKNASQDTASIYQDHSFQ